jgi:hypothetical protein
LRAILGISVIFLLLILSISANAETIRKNTNQANITVNCPSEVLIEKGWSNYVSFSFRNTGSTDLTGIGVYVDGVHRSWFDITNQTSTIKVGESTGILAKVLVPSDVAIGDYSFSLILESGQLDYANNFTLRIFNNRDDMMLYQIKVYEDRLAEMRAKVDSIDNSSLNMTYARSLFDQIDNETKLAEISVKTGNYVQATEYIREVDGLVIKASFEVSNPPVVEDTKSQQVPLDSILIYTPLAVIAFLLTMLIYLLRKTKIKNRVRIPNLRIREAVIDNKKLTQLESEIRKTLDSQMLLEDEYKQGLISKGSYDELKTQYQEKIVELGSRKKDLRGY